MASRLALLVLLPLALGAPALSSRQNNNVQSLNDILNQSLNNDNANANVNGNSNANVDASSSDTPNGDDNSPSPQQIANAVASWMNDTGKVTQFLDTAASFSGDEFTTQAQIALNAEKDELNHKKVLDDALLAADPDVQAANDVLDTQGTFQAVVDVLQDMVDNGPDNAQAQVDTINQNRCVNVLPNIDAYFSAAGSSTVSAVRPTGCLEIHLTVSSSLDVDALAASTSSAATATATAVSESAITASVDLQDAISSTEISASSDDATATAAASASASAAADATASSDASVASDGLSASATATAASTDASADATGTSDTSASATATQTSEAGADD